MVFTEWNITLLVMRTRVVPGERTHRMSNKPALSTSRMCAQRTAAARRRQAPMAYGSHHTKLLHPPRAACEPGLCVFRLRALLLRSCFVCLFYFSSLPSPFSISISTSFVSSCLFLVGTMLSPRFRFLRRLVQHMIRTLIRTHADLTFHFILV